MLPRCRKRFDKSRYGLERILSSSSSVCHGLNVNLLLSWELMITIDLIFYANVALVCLVERSTAENLLEHALLSCNYSDLAALLLYNYTEVEICKYHSLWPLSKKLSILGMASLNLRISSILTFALPCLRDKSANFHLTYRLLASSRSKSH